MTSYDRFELKFASALVGLMEIWMAAVVGLSEARDPLSRALRANDIAGGCAALMAVLGIAVVVGSVWPLRVLRHWGLAATFIVSVYLIVLTAYERGVFGMTAGALLLLLVGSFVLLGADVVKGAEHKEGRRC